MKHSFTSLLLTLAVLLVTTTGCSSRKITPLGEIPPSPAPASTEVVSAKGMIENDLEIPDGAMIRSGPQYQRVRTMVTRLSKAGNFGDVEIPVYVVNAGDDVNAMAVNGGAILVFLELLNRVHDDNQLATVLGHEIAHIAAKHHSDDGEEERATGVSVFSTILGTTVGVAAAIATGSGSAGRVLGDLTSSASNTVGEGAIVKAYSRDMEYEADQVGMMIMARAGYDPHAAIIFWEHANEIFGDDQSDSSFFSTHPNGPERVEALKEALPYALKQRKG